MAAGCTYKKTASLITQKQQRYFLSTAATHEEKKIVCSKNQALKFMYIKPTTEERIIETLLPYSRFSLSPHKILKSKAANKRSQELYCHKRLTNKQLRQVSDLSYLPKLFD